jgi:hypothetical protein
MWTLYVVRLEALSAGETQTWVATSDSPEAASEAARADARMIHRLPFDVLSVEPVCQTPDNTRPRQI